MTPALRAALGSIAALLFFLEGESVFAQATEEPWRVVASYGQASAPTSQGFADVTSLSFARDFRLLGPLRWSVELSPVFVVRETRVDAPSRARETAWAVAALPLLVYDALVGPVGLRLEGGAGVLWATAPVPAEGSRPNFLDVVGARASMPLATGASVSVGLRLAHISNLGLAGPGNPGLSFSAAVLALNVAR